MSAKAARVIGSLFEAFFEDPHLLPDEAQRNIDSATLFPFAYKGHSTAGAGGFKPRMSIYPILIGLPLTVVIVMAFVYRFYISDLMQQIQSLVQ